MKILFWNARGLANQPTRLVLKNLCESHKPDFVLISEPWMLLQDFPLSFWNHLNLKPFAVNDRITLPPNLWCLCQSHLTPSLLAVSKQQVAFSVLHENQNIYVSAIYASTAYLQRRLLWAELLNLQQSYIGPWCFVGDFNAVLGAHESRGGHLPLRISCEDFQDWTDTGNLTHVLTRGA